MTASDDGNLIGLGARRKETPPAGVGMAFRRCRRGLEPCAPSLLKDHAVDVIAGLIETYLELGDGGIRHIICNIL